MLDYLNKVSSATNNNNHTAALIEIARYVAKKHNQLDGIEKLIKSGEAIEALHNSYGYLTPSLKNTELYTLRLDYCI